MNALSPTINILDPELIENPYDFYATLRRDAPVWEVPGTGVHYVSTWDAIMDALQRPEDFSSNLTGALVRGADGRPDVLNYPEDVLASTALSTADPPMHTLHRRLVQPILSMPAVAAMEPGITAAVDSLLDGLLARGECEAINEMCGVLPARVVSELLGFSRDDAPQVLAWGKEGGALLDGTHSLEELVPVFGLMMEMAGFIEDRMKEASAGRGHGVAGVLAGHVDAGTICERDARNMLVIMLGAAIETTLSLIGNVLWVMLRTPGMQDRLRADPALITPFIEESARLESPFRGHYRVVKRDCTLQGVNLRAGQRLLLLWSSANRDPAAFDRPDELDLGRDNSRRHMAFGQGLHFCLGRPLARLETRVLMERLLARTTHISAGEKGMALHPSIFVRRLETLHLRFA